MEGVDVGETLCVYVSERKRVSLGERWDEGKAWGQRLKNARTPKSPID